ncbi:hypothetical protein NA63_1290 [Flavobacteriaceae bacterium MAR_2010_105]|nr:hypothetical protein NA63_1290 [Flavobacteriaceae bacterium MAR_2010_105]
MSNKENNTRDNSKENFQITPKGSLGLLALGDVGLRAWRKVKQESFKKDNE